MLSDPPDLSQPFCLQPIVLVSAFQTKLCPLAVGGLSRCAPWLAPQQLGTSEAPGACLHQDTPGQGLHLGVQTAANGGHAFQSVHHCHFQLFLTALVHVFDQNVGWEQCYFLLHVFL